MHKKTPRGTARAKRRQNLKAFQNRPEPLPAHVAIKYGDDSAEWNRYLSTLSDYERKKVVKQIRGSDFMAYHPSSGPSPKTFPKFNMLTGGGNHE
jgi:hypothetical protein